ncbi:MAG: ribonuclease H-like domain-containing protein, partial [Polyangiaceae bacterium]|nr:ribonuclease H-like domain-containing protein [Polyangiaceae bacterium]
DRLPAAPYHRIVSMGVCWFDASHTVIRFGIVGEGKDEEGTLLDFVRFFEHKKPVVVSWNGRSFEMPVIAARCFKYGIPFAHYYEERSLHYRYSTDGHLDLMDFLSDFGASHPARLDTASRLIGLPGKMGVEGKDVGPLVHAGRLAEVQAYCLSDVIQIAALFLRTQLARGILDLAAYRRAMSELLRQADQDARIAHVMSAVDRPTVLLEGKGTSTP